MTACLSGQTIIGQGPGPLVHVWRWPLLQCQIAPEFTMLPRISAEEAKGSCKKARKVKDPKSSGAGGDAGPLDRPNNGGCNSKKSDTLKTMDEHTNGMLQLIEKMALLLQFRPTVALSNLDHQKSAGSAGERATSNNSIGYVASTQTPQMRRTHS